MSKTLGPLTLSPIKEDGKFVFFNREVRMNYKLNKGDSIKIYVTSYAPKDERNLLTDGKKSTSKMVVKAQTITTEHEADYPSVEALYEAVCELYRNQFLFGKIG